MEKSAYTPPQAEFISFGEGDMASVIVTSPPVETGVEVDPWEEGGTVEIPFG